MLLKTQFHESFFLKLRNFTAACRDFIAKISLNQRFHENFFFFWNYVILLPHVAILSQKFRQINFSTKQAKNFTLN